MIYSRCKSNENNLYKTVKHCHLAKFKYSKYGSIEVKIHSLPHLRCLSNRSREDINFTALIILIIFSGHDCMKVETKRSSASPRVSNIRKLQLFFDYNNSRHGSLFQCQNICTKWLSWGRYKTWTLDYGQDYRLEFGLDRGV